MDANQRCALGEVANVEEAMLLAVSGITERSNTKFAVFSWQHSVGFRREVIRMTMCSEHVRKTIQFLYKHSSLALLGPNRP